MGIVVMSLTLTAVTLAHMKFVKALPAVDSIVAAKPARIQIWFTESPDPAVSKLALTGPGGAVKLGPVTVERDRSIAAPVDGATPDGQYTVAWQAAGNDGHVQKGEFKFSVRQTR
jgi:hypothetical protein